MPVRFLDDGFREQFLLLVSNASNTSSLQDKGIAETLKEKDWLVGALLTELSAVLYTLGAVFMRKAGNAAALARLAAGQHTAGSPAALAQLPAAVQQRASRPCIPPAPIGDLLCSTAYWVGLCLRALACLIWWRARCHAPDTTVAPLYLSVSFLTTMAGGAAILHEQYHRREVLVALSCIALVLLAAYIDKLAMDPWPSFSTWIVDLDHLRAGDGGALLVCALLWLLAFTVSLAIVLRGCMPRWRSRCCMRARGYDINGQGSRERAAPIPVLSGLTSGATYFVGYVGFSFCADVQPEDEITSAADVHGASSCVALGLLMILSVAFATEGARRFDCRYFVPAYNTIGFFTATIMRVLLVHHRHDVPGTMWVVFALTHVALLVLPFSICSAPATIRLPQGLKRDDSPRPPSSPKPSYSPFRHGTVDPLPLMVTPLLEMVGETAGDALPEPEREAPMLRLWAPDPEKRRLTTFFAAWVKFGLFLPAFALASFPALITICFLVDASLGALILVLYTSWAVGITGLRVAVYSSVGRHRIQLCVETDYNDLLSKHRGRRRGGAKRHHKAAGGGRVVLMKDPFDPEDSSSSGSDDEDFWRSVRHFVVVEGDWDPADTASRAEICGLLQSVARSPMADTQLGVFLVARTDEDDAYKRAVVEFERVYRESIKHTCALDRDVADAPASPTRRQPRQTGAVQLLFCADAADTSSPSGHGQGLRGRSTLAQLVEHAKRCQCKDNMVLVTYTTPDAVFQPGYWCALTFAFLASGQRRTTIWQAPVFFLKGHLDQRAAIRHASLFLAQSQLASLTDPLAVPLPKSTCSLPLSLLRAIDSCWEPDFQLPLHNASLWTKCWLTTIGRSSVQPIFQPVLRRAAQEDGGCIPRAAMEAHARGLFELVYFWGALPLALLNGFGGSSSVACNRLICLVLRSMPPLIGITQAHITISTWWLAMFANGLMLLLGRLASAQLELNSIRFLAGVTAELLGFGVFPLLLLSNEALLSQLAALEALVDGRGGAERRPALFGRCCVGLRLAWQGVFAGPAFLCTAFCAEWRTALSILSGGDGGGGHGATTPEAELGGPDEGSMVVPRRGSFAVLPAFTSGRSAASTFVQEKRGGLGVSAEALLPRGSPQGWFERLSTGRL